VRGAANSSNNKGSQTPDAGSTPLGWPLLTRY
jgi:hypothetical protein